MKPILNFNYKRKVVSFLRSYRAAKQNARDLMLNGDIQSYMKELIRTEKEQEKAQIMLSFGC